MFHPTRDDGLTLAERLRTDGGRRVVGIVLALAFEILLLLILLTLSRGEGGIGEDAPILSTFDAGEEIEDAPEQPEPEPQPEAAAPRTVDQPQPPQPDTPPAPASAPAIQLPRESTQTFDLAEVPREPAKPAPARPMMGPPAPRAGRNDTPIVGRRANGEPIYRADWYREPSPQELRGYLSTAAPGPGWALIECQTAPDFRVENCEFVSEYPQGSQLGRAWLAASWQFRVRPPRKGNSYLVGEWVRIRLVLNRE